jgi:hypothetical protein
VTTDGELFEQLGEDWIAHIKVIERVSLYLAQRVCRTLPDGREATVELRMYNSRLVVGAPGSPLIDDSW